MGKWLAGIVAAVIAGLVVAWFIGDWPAGNGGEPETGGNGSPMGEQTPAEAIAGDWSLVSWREAPSDITLGMEPTAGSLEAGSGGGLTWTLEIETCTGTTAEPLRLR